jgi:tRNA(Ile)-lysidine synthase
MNTYCKNVIEKVASFVRAHKMCPKGAKILIACSAGQDSIALLDIMYHLTDEFGYSLGAAYIDHQQNSFSKSAGGLVKRKCSKRKIWFHHHILEGIEQNADEAFLREKRYQALLQIASDHGYSLIATGHTQSDQVETILMRIIRGTSVAGLAGIPAIRDKNIIRPLLECNRNEITNYLKFRQQRWLEDPTNENRKYVRNRIRLDILPTIKEHLNPAIDQALLRLCQAAERDNQFFEQAVDSIEITHEDQSTVSVKLDELCRIDDALKVRVVLKMLQELLQSGSNIEQNQMKRIIEAINNPKKRDSWKIDLSGNTTASIKYGKFQIGNKFGAFEGEHYKEVVGPGEVLLGEGNSSLVIDLIANWDYKQACKEHVYFDADKVEFPLIIRSLTAGDRIRIWKGKGSRKVSRILIDEKVPRHQRKRIPLVVKDNRILWIAGIRRSDFAPVDEKSKKILSIMIKEGRS